MSRGIDYSGPGSTANRNPEIGIRYGVISLHKLGDHAAEEFEAIYVARCPHCQKEVPDDTHFTAEQRPAGKRHGYWTPCPSCDKPFAEDDQHGDEPDDNVVDDGVYKARLASDGDTWWFESPFFTRAAFCSPCAPGACYLSDPCDDGERCYCPGPEWFDDLNPPPFPIYSVATGELIVVTVDISGVTA